MILIGSSEHPGWDPPRPFAIDRVVRGRGRWLRRYAIGTVDLGGSPVRVAVTIRSSWAWRVGESPREALLWHLGEEPAPDTWAAFEQPERGAEIVFVMERDQADG